MGVWDTRVSHPRKGCDDAWDSPHPARLRWGQSNMGHKKNGGAGSQGVGTPEQLLPQLRLIYGRSSNARDIFGRRPALPSEVAKVIRGTTNGHAD